MNTSNHDEPNRAENALEANDERLVDPIELVNQQLERQPSIDPEDTVGNSAVTPQMLDEGDNLRDDYQRE